MDLFKIALGPECVVEGQVIDGKALLKAEYKGEDDVEMTLIIKAGPRAAIEKLKAMIPGKLDDLALEALANFLGV